MLEKKCCLKVFFVEDCLRNIPVKFDQCGSVVVDTMSFKGVSIFWSGHDTSPSGLWAVYLKEHNINVLCSWVYYATCLDSTQCT